ncbi:MAG: DUF998 domain-containing protein [Bacteroidetes bacterium]|nr:DUF998 domain-containing protein [Bacteroidota bacterium]
MNIKPFSQKTLLIYGIIGAVLFIGIYLVFGFITPGFDLLRDTISSLELVKNGWVQRINFIAFGIFTLLFTIGLANELVRGINGRLILIFQSLIAIGLIGDGIFIHDPMHMACDLVTFNSVIVVLVLFTRQFYLSAGWRGWILYSILSALLMMIFLFAFGAANAHHGLAGLYERLAVLPRTVWSILLIVNLLNGKRLGAAGASPAY